MNLGEINPLGNGSKIFYGLVYIIFLVKLI